MSAAVAMVALLTGFAPVVTLFPAAEIEVPGRAIRVADIATLSGLDPESRARLSARVVAVLPSRRESMILSREALAGLLRRAMPAFRVTAGESSNPVRIRTALRPPSIRPNVSCFVLSQPVRRGDSLSLEDVSPAACDARKSKAPILFDRRDSKVRADRDLSEGAYLDRIVLPRERGADPGDRLTLTTVVGPTRVERDVIALQAGRSGHKLFVRSADGEVLTAPFFPKGERGGR